MEGLKPLSRQSNSSFIIKSLLEQGVVERLARGVYRKVGPGEQALDALDALLAAVRDVDALPNAENLRSLTRALAVYDYLSGKVS